MQQQQQYPNGAVSDPDSRAIVPVPEEGRSSSVASLPGRGPADEDALRLPSRPGDGGGRGPGGCPPGAQRSARLGGDEELWPVAEP